ncbi:SusD/RagB family nutrient-binding outer membrane lipoprotein [Chitinophaga rhizophila]|uniref:SusD/RagB family nutrient-binding outer membrane lipoprotein n=1 Tax=Chitinophaga rhizophila TaxID=2866212 RepID=A0ABS7G8R9_9BACT|nr:SusD/RagB family nutrient-binding outer membrane lipoprotein [Chitinophaga rhizophila]MBW8684056.1 SusD/RagB family nutrient-binding outer membrane lipoprotein [Chitinophaga rhizophila]
MNNRKSVTEIIIILLPLLILQVACTRNFESINTNPYDMYDDELQGDFRLIGDPLVQAMLNIYVSNDVSVTQLQQNLMGDVFSGYMMTPSPFQDNRNNITYDLLDNWNDDAWLTAYGNVMPNCRFVMDKCRGRYPDFYAWAKIIRVLAMHRVSDIYGPIIYTRYAMINEDRSIDYDTQEEVYNAFFKDLDSAITTLSQYIPTATDNRFRRFDLSYNGDYTKWIKLANTIRLRLALRISAADPVRARQEGEAALNQTYGLLYNTEDNFNISIAPVTHPLNVICNSWNDIRMGAPMESFLCGYRDPRLPHYFVPADTKDSIYHGIRNGITITSKDIYAGFSKLAWQPSRIQLCTASEAFFLKAEAALYSWKGAGDAQENYEKGIYASFRQYNLTNAYHRYVNDDTLKPKPYTDPQNPVNNIPEGSVYLSQCTIRWNEQAPEHEKLERIITQKWIAVFPDGQEAWSEFRRTGYPKLFPIVINNSGGKIPSSSFIRRIPFIQFEYATNPAGVKRAISKLRGEDNGGIRLWWDRK